MAKSDPSSTFGDFSKKIKLDPSRQNLKPVDPNWSFEKHLSYALQEGYALLAEDAKKAPKASVKVLSTAVKSDSVKLETKLGEISKNAYVRARAEVLQKMNSETRAIIEKMEQGELPKDLRWDTFCKTVTIKGDQLSGLN